MHRILVIAQNSIAASAGEVVEFPGFDDITYMQQMTSEVCSKEVIGATKQLVDIRDHKFYWVSKLKDGNCWMTQNLDFDIPSVLSNATSDVSEASIDTEPLSKPTPIVDWHIDNTYYDPGDYYYVGRNGDHRPGNKCSTTVGLNECEGFATSGDSHYHVGNYYSWKTATVGSGNNLVQSGDKAPESICPKGWQLPLGGSSDPEVVAPWNYDKSFHRLFISYGWKYTTGRYYIGSNEYQAYEPPLYFAFAGAMFDNGIHYVSSDGFYWSSIFWLSDRSFSMHINDSNVYAAPYNYNSNGISIRCVVK